MHENTEFTLSRDTESIQIPSGKQDHPGCRHAGRDHANPWWQLHHRDVLRPFSHRGKGSGRARNRQDTNQRQRTAAGRLSTGGDGAVDDKAVWDQLRQCYDPEIPVNIVDLGLVYDCQLKKGENGGTKVEVKMTLTAPGCGMGPAIAHDAQSKIMSIEGVDEAQVDLVWDPPWNQGMISEAGRMKLGMV